VKTSGTIDFELLCRSGIGFDHLFDVIRQAMKVGNLANSPPYNVERWKEDRYRLTLAVAGWTVDEITVTTVPNLLVVSGKKAEPDDKHYLYRGIPMAAFEQRFILADDMQVRAAQMADGLLTIDLVREVAQASESHHVQITSRGEPQGTEATAAA
jgi:molecular chaperone IbpA